jgi:hypothetical protein
LKNGPTVYSPAAPRIVTGPNGFEKWIAYRAWWNGQPGTGLDRVFFFNNELVIDGPTTADTSGHHPPPAQPTFSDRFEKPNPSGWDFAGGKWTVEAGALHQTDERQPAIARLARQPAANYLFETHIRFPEKGKGTAGIVAWSNGKKKLVVGINPAAHTWEYSVPGNLAPKRFKLPKTFSFLETPPGTDDIPAPLHRLRVTKNGGHFEVMLDHIRLTKNKPIMTQLTGPGVPGLYCNGMAAEFDGVVYTIGWDEHNEYITGWGAAADGTAAGGKWEHKKDEGLLQRKHSETGRAFKGDLLGQYEFTINAKTRTLEESEQQTYGILPVFTDSDNWLKAMIDTHERQLVVLGKLNGRDIGPFKKSLRCRIPHRHLYDPETSWRNTAAWVYSLRSQSVITGLDVRWLEGKHNHLQQEFFVPADDLLVRYARLDRNRESIPWDDGRFYEADEPRPASQKPGVLNPVSIRPETGSHVALGSIIYAPSTAVVDSKTKEFLRWLLPGEIIDPEKEEEQDGPVNAMASETPARPQETLICVEAESSYFFRCIKLKDRVIIELNGRPMITVEGQWPASQVGLLTEGQPCFYNGIALHHLTKE